MAWGSTFDEQLGQVRALLESGAYSEAISSLEDLESNVPQTPTVVSRNAVATMFFYRGVAEYMGRRRWQGGKVMEWWRKTLVVENAFEYQELTDNVEHISLFEILRGEVVDWDHVDVGVPEKTGVARLYVNGVLVEMGQEVIDSQHLIQVECPGDQGVHGAWVEFSGGVDWLALCPDGVDISEMPEEVVETDEWSEFGPTFSETPSDQAQTDVAHAPLEPAVEDVSPEEPVADVSPDLEVTTVDTPRVSGRGTGPGLYLMASGGALMAGGVAVNFVFVNPAYDEIVAANSNPESILRAEADELTSHFQFLSTVTIGLVAGGAVLTGTGFFVESTVRPIFGWNTLGISGEF